MNDQERSEWRAWQESGDDFVDDATADRFKRKHFVSTSRGRSKGIGRKPLSEARRRTHLAEVTLLADVWEPGRPQRWYTEQKFPFDTKATEHTGNSSAESDWLRNRIDRL